MSTINAAATPQPFKNTTFSRISTEFQHHVRGTSRREIAKNRLVKELKNPNSEETNKEIVNEVYKSVYGSAINSNVASMEGLEDKIRLQQIQLKMAKTAYSQEKFDAQIAFSKFDQYMSQNKLKPQTADDFNKLEARYSAKRNSLYKNERELSLSLQQTKLGRTLVQAPITLLFSALMASAGPAGAFFGLLGIIQSSGRILKNVFKPIRNQFEGQSQRNDNSINRENAQVKKAMDLIRNPGILETANTLQQPVIMTKSTKSLAEERNQINSASTSMSSETITKTAKVAQTSNLNNTNETLQTIPKTVETASNAPANRDETIKPDGQKKNNSNKNSGQLFDLFCRFYTVVGYSMQNF